MPRKDINLLPQDLKEQKKSEKIKKSLGNLSLLSLVVVGLITFASSAYLVRVKLTEATFKKDIVKTESEIKDLLLIEKEARRLESKINVVADVKESRSRYSLLLEALAKAVPGDVGITSLATFGASRVSVSGLSQSYLSLSRFITSALDPILGGKVFSSVDITAASLDEVTGKIRFSLVLYLRDGGIK